LITRELRRQRVTVVDYPDGRPAIRYRGSTCPTPPLTLSEVIADLQAMHT
jgi:hypothetical protein